MGVEIFVYLFDSQPYEEAVLPAYRTFKEKSDASPLIRMIENELGRLESISAGFGAPGWSRAIYQEEIEILLGKRYYSSQGKEANEGQTTTPEDMHIFVDSQVAPDLVRLLCLPRNMGLNPEQSMSRAALMNYLYSRSRWIEEHFTGSKEPSGPMPEINIGEWSRFFSQQQVGIFDAELSQMKQPENEDFLADGFTNLKAVVHTAATHPRFKLLFVIS